MTKPETCINQTVLIWAVVVIIEIFVIAYLLNFPWLILTGFIMYGPIKAAMNWPIPLAIEENKENAKETADQAAAN